VNDRVLPVLMILLGAGILVRTIAAGGGATSVGLIFGILLLVAGALRLYAEHRRRAS
jgi:hypothetical protein